MSFTPLTKRSDFLTIRNQGTSAVAKGIILQAFKHNRNNSEVLCASRVGITVSNKLGKAVVRNRIKRRLRALCVQTLVRCANTGYDYVLIARTHTLDRTFSQLDKDLKFTLYTTGTFAHEAPLHQSTDNVWRQPHGTSS